MIHAAVGGSMKPSDFGINSGWGGLRTTKSLVQLFPDANGSRDKRGCSIPMAKILKLIM